MRLLVKDIQNTGRLRPGLSVNEAADVVWALNSSELYVLLTVDRVGLRTASRAGWPTPGPAYFWTDAERDGGSWRRCRRATTVEITATTSANRPMQRRHNAGEVRAGLATFTGAREAGRDCIRPGGGERPRSAPAGFVRPTPPAGPGS